VKSIRTYGAALVAAIMLASLMQSTSAGYKEGHCGKAKVPGWL
jgi:hypothetical protein